MRRLRRLLPLAAVGIVLAVLAWYVAAGRVQLYGRPGHSVNGGVVVRVTDADSFGLELWGHPGFFHNVD